jgi:hypothetical protein
LSCQAVRLKCLDDVATSRPRCFLAFPQRRSEQPLNLPQAVQPRFDFGKALLDEPLNVGT